MKKRILTVILLTLTAGILFSLAGCGKTAPSKEELSRLTADAILSDNESSYADGECCGEGHKILGYRLSGGRLKIYALTMFGYYGFQNDMFIKTSGSGVIPAVLTFEKDGDGYRLREIEYPRDGAGYVKSIKRMFPLPYRAQALHFSDKQQEELSAQERLYAEAYLKSIGREAEVGEFRDLNVILLTDCGVSVEVSNALSCDKRLGEYPFWIGTTEALENGVRFVRSLSLDEEAGQIVYKTVEKDSGAVTEIYIFDAVTGEELAVPPSAD